MPNQGFNSSVCIITGFSHLQHPNWQISILVPQSCLWSAFAPFLKMSDPRDITCTMPVHCGPIHAGSVHRTFIISCSADLLCSGRQQEIYNENTAWLTPQQYLSIPNAFRHALPRSCFHLHWLHLRCFQRLCAAVFQPDKSGSQSCTASVLRCECRRSSRDSAYVCSRYRHRSLRMPTSPSTPVSCWT